MSIRFKLALAMDALLALALFMFGAIIYNSEKALLLRQARESRENTLKALVSVTVDSVSGDDDTLLISYTYDIKRIIKELAVAYVSDGRYILAHTDRKMAPRQLPLSNQGDTIHAFTNRLLVRKAVPPENGKGISFSRKRLVVKGRAYDVVVGYSDQKLQDNMRKALDEVLASLLKAGALAILAATLLAFWLSARLTRPISALVKAFAATGAGDLTQRLEETGRRDEIGVLKREFNRMVASLRELDEMKKDFVSSVTHELKSPLGAIESYLDLMAYEIAQGAKDPCALGAKLPKFLENISFVKQNSGRLLRFITDLLDAAKIEKGKFEISRKESKLEPIVNNALQLFRERAKASGVELKAELPAGLPQAMLDPERITQVLVNLVSNALKFTPRGGSVTVSASVVRPDRPAPPDAAGRAAPPAEVTARRALRVVVEDTGPGISREALAKLFGKFYQVPGSRSSAIGPKGTGLGLYIVRNIVEAHGGRAFAESSGKGSRFGFELPV